MELSPFEIHKIRSSTSSFSPGGDTILRLLDAIESLQVVNEHLSETLADSLGHSRGMRRLLRDLGVRINLLPHARCLTMGQVRSLYELADGKLSDLEPIGSETDRARILALAATCEFWFSVGHGLPMPQPSNEEAAEEGFAAHPGPPDDHP